MIFALIFTQIISGNQLIKMLKNTLHIFPNISHESKESINDTLSNITP